MLMTIIMMMMIGVMQATTMTGTKLEKRYSPSFHEDSNRKQSASKRKRDDVLRLVFYVWKWCNILNLFIFSSLVWLNSFKNKTKQRKHVKIKSVDCRFVSSAFLWNVFILFVWKIEWLNHRFTCIENKYTKFNKNKYEKWFKCFCQHKMSLFVSQCYAIL